MASNLKLFKVYVPCYNEEQAIVPLTEQFEALSKELLKNDIQLKVYFVDDKSTDKTNSNIQEAIANKPHFELIEHKVNKNLVGVLETFLETANQSQDQSVLGYGILDGDNSHPPLTFVPMVQKILQGYDVVVASRYQPGSIVQGVPYYRQLLSLGMSIIFRLFGRMKNIRDYGCGFRAYSAQIIKKVGPAKFQSRSFACMVELLTLCKKQGAKMTEVPFVLKYDQKLSASKMKFFSTISQTLKVLWSK